MLEFKYSPEIVEQVSELKSACEAVNKGYSDIGSDGVETLTTATRYIEQAINIKSLFDLYRALISKDINDINSMIGQVVIMDETIANSNKE